MTEKVSRDDYFTAAFELLAIGGKSALTTTAVCRRIGVTTGSLYHHFGSGAALYRAVIDYWENDVTVAQRRRVDAVADPRERLATLEQAAREADHEVEKAIRSWALADRYVAAAQQRVDQVRHEHLTKHYIEAGFTPARADTLARIGFSILVGAQQFGTRVDHKRLNSALDEYSAWVNSSVSAEVTTSH
ncbi:TetR/AcrR family transcriptional regulator [Mycobacteroides abscessus]|uniref:TetR/AcrR family transcriptional regulator n=1 Tax=Mycobacteroides abscessus TaxID=36809 RepID=UPI0005E2A0FF|nr:TetR/AcrR family transcriptional regulator [Mycobacteroides abscessus]RIS67207.1 TetR/AcrR family transcriptional regulator [Mycobacteroides abscessus]RIT53610.1 TetR/AcrR family transcriptional regulator [Mycobacteroides abscessus]CPW49057.1 Putative transcriptional regulator%2C TetR family [Mycobacteroides abscessus]SKS98123.1 TetR family transcriptional regulator [Mycobacteroides abscessus subsp. massiliense]SKT44127.1 TetR family transcriptional regulator [Mycobacteroides abscessus subs